MSCEDLIERINQAREGNGRARSQAEEARRQQRLEEILDDYQVPDDGTIKSKLFGTDEDGNPNELTDTEVRMLRNIAITGAIGSTLLAPVGLGPLGLTWASSKLAEIKVIENQATTESNQRYCKPEDSDAPDIDGHRDAFRHAYMSALMTRAMDPDWAKRFTDAHEGKPGSPDSREAMDLYNNEVGIRIARENPGASDKELADLIFQAVENGEMVVIDQEGDGLVWSNDRDESEGGVPLWGHVAASGENTEGTLPPGL